MTLTVSIVIIAVGATLLGVVIRFLVRRRKG